MLLVQDLGLGASLFGIEDHVVPVEDGLGLGPDDRHHGDHLVAPLPVGDDLGLQLLVVVALELELLGQVLYLLSQSVELLSVLGVVRLECLGEVGFEPGQGIGISAERPARAEGAGPVGSGAQVRVVHGDAVGSAGHDLGHPGEDAVLAGKHGGVDVLGTAAAAAGPFVARPPALVLLLVLLAGLAPDRGLGPVRIGGRVRRAALPLVGEDLLQSNELGGGGGLGACLLGLVELRVDPVPAVDEVLHFRYLLLVLLVLVLLLDTLHGVGGLGGGLAAADRNAPASGLEAGQDVLGHGVLDPPEGDDPSPPLDHVAEELDLARDAVPRPLQHLAGPPEVRLEALELPLEVLAPRLGHGDLLLELGQALLLLRVDLGGYGEGRAAGRRGSPGRRRRSDGDHPSVGQALVALLRTSALVLTARAGVAGITRRAGIARLARERRDRSVHAARNQFLVGVREELLRVRRAGHVVGLHVAEVLVDLVLGRQDGNLVGDARSDRAGRHAPRQEGQVHRRPSAEGGVGIDVLVVAVAVAAVVVVIVGVVVIGTLAREGAAGSADIAAGLAGRVVVPVLLVGDGAGPLARREGHVCVYMYIYLEASWQPIQFNIKSPDLVPSTSSSGKVAKVTLDVLIFFQTNQTNLARYVPNPITWSGCVL